jgi:predicted O-methyltransferase YrrM
MKLLEIIIRPIVDWKAKLNYNNLALAFNLQSHLTIQERVQLYKLSDTASRIAEIGSYIGASACCFGAASTEVLPKKIICIDTWNNDAMTEGYRDTWFEFKSNTEKFANQVVTVRGFSTDVVEQVRAITPTLDLLFIDGDHSYQGVRADWNAYKSFLTPGSIVIFHDYGWAEGVKRVVHEDVVPLVSRHGKLPNMWWGWIR